MHLPDKTEIDILNFIKTGKFDYLKIGQSKEWILNNFPDPDNIGCGDSLKDAAIWYYGNIELHFYKDRLSLLFSENISDLDGGNHLKIKKWILNDSRQLTLQKFIGHLNSERIDFSKKTEILETEYVRLTITASSVQLTFIQAETELKNQNDFRLSAFSLK